MQENDAGIPYSISLAEYAVALYMRTVLENFGDDNPEITIIAPSTL